MADTNIQNTDTSNLSNVLSSWEVDSEWLDNNSDDDKETYYYFDNWNEYLGYYKNVPELNVTVDAKANWTVGKGWDADDTTTLILDNINGNGIDSFGSIMENMVRTYQIIGDSFAEIITEEDYLVNLKPIDPSKMRIVANKKGRIIRYDQITGQGGEKGFKPFSPDKIFHLSRNRLGDEIHGQDMIKPVLEIIKMRNEAMADMRTLMHRHVKPVMIFHLDTDDPTAIANFKAKADKANADGENLYVPKGNVEIDVASVAPNATLNPLPWIEQLNNYFFQATGVPDIVVGGSKALTEASVKTAYLAFENTIAREQSYNEAQFLLQVNLQIKFKKVASLQNEMLSDQSRDKQSGITQPNEMSQGGAE